MKLTHSFLVPLASLYNHVIALDCFNLTGQYVEELKSLADDDVFLPTATDYEAVRKELLVLVARVLVQHVPCLRTLQNIVPSHIIHKHSADTAKASITVSVWKSTSAGWNEPFAMCVMIVCQSVA